MKTTKQAAKAIGIGHDVADKLAREHQIGQTLGPGLPRLFADTDMARLAAAAKKRGKPGRPHGT